MALSLVGVLKHKVVRFGLIGMVIISHIWMIQVGTMTPLEYSQHAWSLLVIGVVLLAGEMM